MKDGKTQSADAPTMRIVSWNLNHKTNLKDIPPAACEGLLSLRPDVIVLTEYVHGPSRSDFLNALKLQGIGYWLVSDCTPRENHIIIASRSSLEHGSIRAPEIAPSVPSNALHAILPMHDFEILGIRIPDYRKKTKIRNACWDWIADTAERVKHFPFVMIGDLNTDPMDTSRHCGDRIGMLVAAGWQLATPPEGASYWNLSDGSPRRIDHAFVSRHFAITGTKFVTDFDGRNFVGLSRGMLSDHAILQIDLERVVA